MQSIRVSSLLSHYELSKRFHAIFEAIVGQYYPCT
jgi:hypothetical protein